MTYEAMVVEVMCFLDQFGDSNFQKRLVAEAAAQRIAEREGSYDEEL